MDVPVIRRRITQIEDLRDAVDRAGLSAFQRSRESPRGTLVHVVHDGIALSSGHFDSRVQIRGALSQEALSLCVGLRIPSGNLLLSRAIDTGIVSAFRPGDEQDAFHDIGSRYAVITLSEEVLEREAERHGITLARNVFRHTGVHPRPMRPAHLTTISAFLARLHQEDCKTRLDSSALVAISVALIGHFGQGPAPLTLPPLRQRERLVEQTRAHIDQNLGQQLEIEDLARRAGVSRRTLTRSFEDVVGEPPRSYVARMRLHRIRSDLLAIDPREATIADISNKWGISELGRMSARYRDLFGELPSETRLRGRDYRLARHGNLAPSAKDDV
ncbi:helix-turn-helix transcriptional regulator [Mycolicibacterium pulveris]|uniref:helix-turn-helix transcriptional regulator n=1 Tax=Mycolicibacterium pulveris TaxID=36813 RepID=UPI003CF8DF20